MITKQKCYILLFFILNSFSVFSQITISKFDKEEEQIINKSVPYDSLRNWESLPRLGDYKKYIGQKVYLPKKRNKIKPKDEYQFIAPFLFKKESSLILLDSSNTINYLSKTFVFRPSNISKEYHKTLIIDSVSTNIYKPYLYYGYFNNYDVKYDFRFTTNDVVGNKYYIITDVIYGDKLKGMNFLTKYYYSFDSNQKKSKNDIKPTQILSKNIDTRYSKIAFELRDEATGETLYYIEDGNEYKENRLILVSYFVTQKKKYVGENLFPDGFTTEFEDLKKIITIEDENGKTITKPKEVKIGAYVPWNCIDVTILEGTSVISYILKNKNDETVAVQDLDFWKLEKDILAKEKQDKISMQNLKLEEEKQTKDRILKEKNAFEKRRNECIEKFGNENGELIALGKVKIGMSKEMCKMSWGIPIWSNKITTENGSSELWYYGFVHSLHFVGNELKGIEE